MLEKREYDEIKNECLANGRYWNGMNDNGWTTDDYRKSVSEFPPSENMFSLSYQWKDKAHRHVFDLCNWIDALLDDTHNNKVTGGTSSRATDGQKTKMENTKNNVQTRIP